jgi:hypothetical protein
MRKQIFISHSGKDREIVDAIIRSFDGTGVQPILVEDIEWSKNHEPNWLWIKNQIVRSRALFVILSKGLIAQEHTQNWVAFEIGVAAGCDPPIPVCVITGEHVRFPVPYLNHYFPYSTTSARLTPAGQTLSKGGSDSIMKLCILQPNHSPKERLVCCNCCRTEFYMHGIEQEFECPCCFSMMKQ